MSTGHKTGKSIKDLLEQMKKKSPKTNTSRAIRNNNPGNLVLTSIDWDGKVPNSQNTDGTFEQFTSMKYGARALLMDVINDIAKKGNNTIEKLITEFAPPHENNTAAYIMYVSFATGIKPIQSIPLTLENLLNIVIAIIAMETGTDNAVTKALLRAAFYMLPDNVRYRVISKPTTTTEKAKETIAATKAKLEQNPALIIVIILVVAIVIGIIYQIKNR